ncbi:MAG: twin-arginine translocase subunit TatC [Ferruginibacter sp.]
MATSTSDRKSFFKSIRGKENEEKSEMTFFDHIEDLRWHLIRSLLAFGILASLVFIYRDWVFDNIITAPTREDFISYRMLCKLGSFLHIGDTLCMNPVNINFQINTVNGTFSSAMSLAIVGGLIAAFPYILWELWKFIKPALSAKEIKYARGSIFWVSFFFFCGAAFGYYLLAPFTYNFLANFSLGKFATIKYIPSITDYIDSLTNIMLGCGLAFELPVLSYVLAKLGIISGVFLRKYARLAFIIILIISAIITPSPDWTSMLIVAAPLTLLYWISVLLATKVDKENAEKEAKEWS